LSAKPEKSFTVQLVAISLYKITPLVAVELPRTVCARLSRK
jgi:hypothetical protein